MEKEVDNKVDELAKELILIERKCFYGSESEPGRLKKMREAIDKYSKDIKYDN